MGHDHHFLQRLDRIRREEVDLALSLYRDHELVAHVLAVANLPADAERVAISLGDREEGPFLIVQRDGHFVTCLGKGMKHDCPLLPRDRLDAIVLQLGEYRARRDRLHEATGLDGVQALMDGIVRKEDALTREDVSAVLALAPLMARELFQAYAEFARALEQVLPSFVEMRRCRSGPDVAFAKGYWRALWGQANLLVLLGAAPRAFLDELGDHLVGTGITPTVCPARQGIYAITARGVWFAARAGRSLVPVYKRAIEEKRDFISFQDAACGLYAMGLRHSRLHAEVIKALRPPSDDLAARDFVALQRNAFVELMEAVRAKPDMEALSLEDGASIVLDIVKTFPEDSPFRALTRLEDVPVDLARTAMLRWLGDTLDPAGHGAKVLPVSLPLVARASAKDFFFPEAFARAQGSLFSADMILRLAERQRAARSEAKPPPVSSTRLQGRNEACACASGRKFKRCCGA